MKSVMKTCVILHNIMADACFQEMAEDEFAAVGNEVPNDEATVGFSILEERQPMLVRFTRNGSATIPGLNALEELCELRSYLQDEEEYCITRKIVMDHLWLV